MKRRSLKRSYKSRSRSYAPARSTSTRRAFPKRSVVRASPHVGLGLSAKTVLRTSFFTNVTAAASGVFTGYLKTGSVFDPCGDLAVIQPQMFDQWASMYNRYKVNSCVVRIKVSGVSCTTSDASIFVGCIYPSVDSTALSTYQAAASQQYAKTTSGGFMIVGNTGLGGPEGKYLSIKFNEDTVTGVKSADTYDGGALVTTDPANLQYSVVPIFLQGAAAGLHKWVLEVDIWQNVTFSNKKNVVDA